jgi:septum formation protein
LTLLSGRSHQVTTALAVLDRTGQARERAVLTRVSFKRLTAAEIDAYLATNEWVGKAGGYGVQGVAGRFVISLTGSYTGVVGLPLYETANLLSSCGVRL